MKKLYIALLAAAIGLAVVGSEPTGARLISPDLVISQVYGGGGNGATSVYSHDFVEIFNRGRTPVSLGGWSTQYASASGSEFLVTPLPNVTLQPGGYFLIQYAGGSQGGLPALPAPDHIAPPITNNAGNTFIPNLSETSGKIALVNSTMQLPLASCPSSSAIVDLLGFGTSASCFEGMRTADLSRTTAARRNAGGCADTDNNNADFAIASPGPRNTSAAPAVCDLGANLQAGINASPNTVSPGGTVLLTVSVIPATTPPSSVITVVGNLTDLGGAEVQPFFDNGTNGDITAGDNVFSYRATIPAGAVGGVRNITAIAGDSQSRTVTLSQVISINAPLPNDDPLLFGNPSGAVADVMSEDNYLMPKPQYTLSYNRSKATANWVAWRLDSSWIGSTDRQDDFRPDPALPPGWYQVQDTDYSGSGYQRGHMTPSGDRTRTATDNSATFLMTNIVPQIGANNEQSWADFENYCRSLAMQGNEIYIISGPAGNIGRIGGGRIVVPAVTWKVVLVLPNGENDLARVNRSTRAFGIIVPNQPPINSNLWRPFRVTVDAVEYLTGYDFFNQIPKNTQELIERTRDLQ